MSQYTNGKLNVLTNATCSGKTEFVVICCTRKKHFAHPAAKARFLSLFLWGHVNNSGSQFLIWWFVWWLVSKTPDVATSQSNSQNPKCTFRSTEINWPPNLKHEFWRTQCLTVHYLHNTPFQKAWLAILIRGFHQIAPVRSKNKNWWWSCHEAICNVALANQRSFVTSKNFFQNMSVIRF